MFPLVYLLLVEFMFLKLRSINLVDESFEVIYLPRSLYFAQPSSCFTSVVYYDGCFDLVLCVVECDIACVVHIS